MRKTLGNYCGFIIFATFAVILLAGCGKKGPPVPPREGKPPPVSDLKARVDGHTLELSWTVPMEEGRSEREWKHFTIYRSKKEMLRPGCKKCPPKFEKAADVPVQSRDMIFRETLEIGYKYIYKVVGHIRNGMVSHGSNRAELVH